MWRPFYPKFFISIYMPYAWRIYDSVEEMNSCHFCEREKKDKKKTAAMQNIQLPKPNVYPNLPPIAYLIQWIFYEVKKKRRTRRKKINVEKQNRKEKHEIISSNKKERNKMYYKYKHVVLFNSSHIVMMMCRYICSKTQTRSILLYFCFISSILFLMKNEDLHILFNLSHKFFIIASNVCCSSMSDIALEKNKSNMKWVCT